MEGCELLETITRVSIEEAGLPRQGQNAHIDCKMYPKIILRGCSESARFRPNPTLYRIRPIPEPPSHGY